MLIGSGSRGAAVPLEIFWPPLDDFCPSSGLYPGPFLGQKNASNPAVFFFYFVRERLILGQKDTPNPAKTFFLKNACF